MHVDLFIGEYFDPGNRVSVRAAKELGGGTVSIDISSLNNEQVTLFFHGADAREVARDLAFAANTVADMLADKEPVKP